MYQLYIANKNYSSWSLRPWLLMTSLQIPFDEHLTPFIAGPVQTPFKAFSPTAKVPCLVDGELVVWDSLAITEYLAERHANVWPVDNVARAWARCAAAEMHSGFFALRNQCAMSCGVRVALTEITPTLRADLDRINTLWAEGLTRFGGPFLAGRDFSAVDAFFAPVVFRIQTYGLPVSESVAAYCQHLLAQSGMRSWYDSALAESWREPAHEDEVTDNGSRTVVEDLRA